MIRQQILDYFCFMVNVGFIGSLGFLVSHFRQLKNLRDTRVIGKSSVGMMDEPERVTLSIPEYDRMELIDAADILIVDMSQLLLPDLLKLAVKKRKHLYIADFPELSPENCIELLKLAEEAKTVIQISNPLLSESLTAWLYRNWQEPAYLSLFDSMPLLPAKRSYLIKHLLYAFSLFKSFPQKIRVTGIHHPDSEFYFISLRLDYSTYSTFNLELLIQSNGGRTLHAAMPGKFLSGDFHAHKAFLNQKEFIVPAPAKNEIADFITMVSNEDSYHSSNFDLYYSTLLVLRDVIRKTELFTPWH